MNRKTQTQSRTATMHDPQVINAQGRPDSTRHDERVRLFFCEETLRQTLLTPDDLRFRLRSKRPYPRKHVAYDPAVEGHDE